MTTGAAILWDCLVQDGVEVVFGIPGGAVVHLVDALPQYPIRFVLMRHEQAAAHAADGYARATGKDGVCMATSGPGATNLVTGIATAYMDSVPLVAITGQVPTPVIGTDAFQEMDITGGTLPITKHNYLVTEFSELARTVREAFRLARSGRPGPVLIDIAKDVQMRRAESTRPEDVDSPGHSVHRPVPEAALRRAAELLNRAQKPLILAGHGVVLTQAFAELRGLAERLEIPLATTLLGISAFPESHPLSLGMAGMHGTPQANRAIQACDVLLAVGTRFDDRLTGDPEAFAPRARIVHLDIDPAEIGKNVRVDVPLVGDAQKILSALLPLAEPARHPQWISEIEAWRGEFSWDEPLQDPDRVRPQYVIHELRRATGGEVLVVSDVGQNQMWEAQYFQHVRPGSLITSGGLGTMGFALPAAIGAQVGQPDQLVWVVAGDGGFQMTLQELATVVQERLPIKIAIINNSYLGLVRQWQELFFDRNYSATAIAGPDFAQLARAYGIQGLTVRSREEVRPAITAATKDPGPVLIDFVVEQEENVFPMVAPGRALSEMLLGDRSSCCSMGRAPAEGKQR